MQQKYNEAPAFNNVKNNTVAGQFRGYLYLVLSATPTGGKVVQ